MMQHTKRLYLVDEFDREYKRLQHPAGAVAKARSPVKMHKTLKNIEMDDHEKAPQYVAELHRYLNRTALTKQLPEQQEKTSLNMTTPSPDAAAKKKKRKKRQSSPEKYSSDWSRIRRRNP